MTETLDKMSNQLVLESLINSNRVVINKIYQECYPSVRYMITSNSGSNDDAQDIFHDAITLVIEKLKKKNFELTSSLKTYLYSVSYNLWQKQLKRKSREMTLPENLDLSENSEHEQKVLDDQLYEIFQDNFDRLNPEYQKILNMYLSKYPMKKITREMGYANEKYAKVKKYMCKEHLKNNILNDPKFKELTLFIPN